VHGDGGGTAVENGEFDVGEAKQEAIGVKLLEADRLSGQSPADENGLALELDGAVVAY
jgi:hypothetical protein